MEGTLDGLGHGQTMGLLPVLGVLCWELCQAGGLAVPWRSCRVIPAWQEVDLAGPSSAGSALPQEIVRAFVPSSRQRLGQHLSARCAPGAGG